MLNRFFLRLIWLMCLSGTGTAALHHDLRVSLDPQRHVIEVEDTVTLAQDHDGSLVFALHPGLQPELTSGGGRLRELNHPAAVRSQATGAAAKRYQVVLPPGTRRFSLRYRGVIRHALQRQTESYARSFQQTRGMISPEGVFLAGTSLWYPHVDGELLSFDLALQLPLGWHGMSQGERTHRDKRNEVVTERWHCATPQEEIYLIAGPFHEYQDTDKGVSARVLLRRPDPALAQKYIAATHQYVQLYSALIGAYPFEKFALVENFWETGYGMPSFTLLGSRVIRLPFILHSSYPHEILHNWWGNGVYVDYASGNWAEGLTSYLADHLIKEQRGDAVDYRRTVLQKYTDYVDLREDFPLTAFRSRHSARTEAVGYGKTLMLFHMLRQGLGDETFIEGLRSLYKEYLFRVAGFPAVERVFSQAAKQPLNDFFAQWVQRAGAPALQIIQARATPHGDKWRLSAVIEQTQAGEAYALRVPIAVHLEGVEDAFQTDVKVDQKHQPLQLEVPARPLQLDIDPEFDVFRRLHRDEIPPAISQAMGAERVLVVLPAQATPQALQAYRALAASWQQDGSDRVDIVVDDALQQLPDDRTVWLFGWNNRFLPRLQQALRSYDFERLDAGVRIEQTTLERQAHSVVVLGRQPRHPDHALGWLASASPAALPGLGRKLPHYGRYSYLAFSGTEPENMLKGQWPVVNSPLSIRVAQSDGATVTPKRARLAPRPALVPPPETFSEARMQADVAFLADRAMAGRGLGTAQLDRAGEYIAGQFRAAGLRPGGDNGSWQQIWEQRIDSLDRTVTLQNIIGILPGKDPERAGESLVIGAHYDHLGYGQHSGRQQDQGEIHPGADDNASGVAVLMELARALRGRTLSRTLVFVAFSGEEHERLGSRYYVRHAANYPPDQMIAMLNLDTVGRLGDKPLILLGTGSAEEWNAIFQGAAYVTGVAVKTVADDFGSSDQTSFIEAGIPAVQFFSGAHTDIHRPGDTLDKLDSAGMVKVAKVLLEAVQYLAERPDILNATGKGAGLPPSGGEGRRVSFGTVPDFAYNGAGIRLDGVRAATPAAAAGLRKGDIIHTVNETPVRNMREYSEALRRLQPGDEIRVQFHRDGKTHTAHTRVTQR